MRNGEMDIVDLPLDPQFFHDAGQFQGGPPASFTHDLDMDPFPSSAKTMAESLDDGLFGGKATGQGRIGVFFLEAIGSFSGSEQAFDKTLAMLEMGLFDPFDLDEVHT